MRADAGESAALTGFGEPVDTSAAVWRKRHVSGVEFTDLDAAYLLIFGDQPDFPVAVGEPPAT